MDPALTPELLDLLPKPGAPYVILWQRGPSYRWWNPSHSKRPKLYKRLSDAKNAVSFHDLFNARYFSLTPEGPKEIT